jgi:2'-5' RNA ligase
MLMRLFMALDMPEEVLERIVEVQESLRESGADLNLPSKKNLHITLKFLGEVEDKRRDEVVKLVSEALEGFRPFSVKVEEVGYFGRGNRINVIWAGVKEGKEKLIDIIESLDEKLKHIRKNEHKPSPHLTIARIRTGRNKEILLKQLKELGDVKFGEFGVKEIILKSSDLTKRGPVYSDIEFFRLREVNR